MAFYPDDLPPVPQKPFIDTLTQADLRKLKAQIEEKLPQSKGNKLKDIDLEEEMVAQLTVTKELQDDVLGDPDIPANQKAQVINATASAIQQLVRMQVDLKRDEQLKRMEAALMKAVALMGDAEKAVFFDTYEQLALTEGVEVDG